MSLRERGVGDIQVQAATHVPASATPPIFRRAAREPLLDVTGAEWGCGRRDGWDGQRPSRSDTSAQRDGRAGVHHGSRPQPSLPLAPTSSSGYLRQEGRIVAVADGVCDLPSVLRIRNARAAHRGRAWTERTAWQAIAMTADVEARLIGQTQRSRLKAALRSMDAETFVSLVRDRAAVHRVTGHRRSAHRIAAEIVNTGTAAARLGLTSAAERIDGYATTAEVQRSLHRHHLSPATGDDDAAVLPAVSDVSRTDVGRINDAGDLLAALSLAESLDDRERSAGLAFIGAALTRRLTRAS